MAVYHTASMDRFLKKEVWEPNSGAPGLANGETTTAPSSSGVSARIWTLKASREVRRGGGGVPLPTGGVVWSGGKYFDFGSQVGEFWCKLGVFCTVHLKLV